MEERTAARIGEWDRREVGDGRVGLSKLGDGEFSGAVDAGDVWVFILNGRIVGTTGGSVESVGARDTLTAYTAPHPSLPLLFAMRERGGEIQSRYFTDDTALAEVHDTLASGKFTGYVELSENVHSGDYYAVYYGGRALFAAFVGAAERLVTGEEAFERANDEVGIYEVNAVDLEIRDPPEPPEDPGRGAGAVGGTNAPGAGGPSGAVGGDGNATDGAGTDAAGPTGGSTRPDPGPRGADAGPAGDARGVGASDPRPTDPESSGSRDDGGIPWDDGRTVPALDPERTAAPGDGAATDSESEGELVFGSGAATGGSGTGDAVDPADAERVADLEAEIDELRDRVASLREERDRLAEKVDRAAAERDRLAAERDELETRLEQVVAEQQTAKEDLVPSEVLEKTDLLVRYDAKSKPTLADAHDGDATPEVLGTNLRLETHTRFDADDTTVDGEDVESFLQDTLIHRFVSWLTGELPFEIRDTGNESGLRDVYDALPEIDRVQFDATVTTRDASGGEVNAVFDVVARNKTGEPIIVADVDEGREPTRGRTVDELLDRTTGVVDAGSSVAGAFLITPSFFDNEVHEAVIDATKTGFFTRDSRASFVKTSRNGGYHVCLVEARNDRFHLCRPDL